MRVFYPLETVVRTAPLGLRCVDIATRSQVSEGLRVTALPSARPARESSAALTNSGFYSLQGLAGLHDFEFGSDEAATVSPPASPAGREFIVGFEDARGRYLPFALLLTLPRTKVVTTYLFSAPGRGSVPGLTVIRGGLRDSTRQLADGSLRPASFARVEAQYELTSPPTVYVGIADWRGEFALLLPAPNPLRPPAGVVVTSPNTSGRKTIAELIWPVTLNFFYQPQRQEFVSVNERGRAEVFAGQRDGVTDVAPERSVLRYAPLLSSLLSQSAAEVVADVSQPAAPSLAAEIGFGKELVVRTAGATDSCVLLVPAPVVSP